MKLWLLRPIDDESDSGPWSPWYDKAFGFVVRAETENAARALIGENHEGGDEIRTTYASPPSVTDPWRDTKLSSCEELTAEGPAEIIIRDFHAA